MNFGDIILKFDFLRISALELDQTLVNDHSVGFPKGWKNDENFENFRKLSEN